MKKIAIVTMIILSSVVVFGQRVNLESTVLADTAKTSVTVQRIEVSSHGVSLKYDYKANAEDVLGIIVPNIKLDSTSSIGIIALKLGDGGPADQFIIDGWYTKRFGNYSFLFEAARITCANARPCDFAGVRISNHLFTVEAYDISSTMFSPEEWNKENHSLMAWAAFHPKHAYFSAGYSEKQYWFFAGTRDFQHFGNLTFLNVDPKTGNYWMRSQTGIGNVNQAFYSLEMYNLATSYLVVPIPFYQHFSPISTKGNTAFKIDSRRVSGVTTTEAIVSKNINHGWLGVAAGINSCFKPNQPLRVAPSFELYKEFKTEKGRAVVELRYDMLAKAASAYLIFNY